MFYRIAKALSIVFIGLLMNGCTSLTEYGDMVVANVPGASYFADNNFARIKIKSSSSTNDGAPFYVLIKETTFATFIVDDYSTITNLVTNPPKDKGCFKTACIVPGENQTVKVEIPDVDSIAVYFLFTNPGRKWKNLFKLEGAFPTIEIALERNEIR